ncbi:hypothetical protein FHS29_006819 [Saccharothrix tamanrassetensis]|uniref:Uncharacterized protein n=1 Tax=Saccharothrix tamanrassetensis TaxID=1051531 RepID=A0A841CXX5_9PSEU|nr:hypothetical protein [Saccharothrix tamanrassetensis]MBB5960196.1 hypothetical protein [Saccharothrix tamanrassetensis]
MSSDVQVLVDELKALRKGYGVQSGDLSARTGGMVRQVCRITDADPPPAQRTKVIATLTGLIDDLPDDLAELARAAFGLDGTADVRYEERLTRIAVRAQRDPRTIRRRVDELLERLAQAALYRPTTPQAAQADAELPDHPWHTTDLTVAVLLDLPVVEVFEQRRIISHRERLTELDHSVTVSEPPGANGSVDPVAVGIDPVRGFLLGPATPVSGNRLAFRVGLPHPLGLDETHAFSFRLRVPMKFAPHYVCTPRQPCDRFTLSVRFGVGRAPERIWRLDGEFPLELNDPLVPRTPLAVDAAGEATASFTDLRPNLSYGIGWDPR